jgi:mannose-6-phosphate isomerase-like protein (cupin superfamily)
MVLAKGERLLVVSPGEGTSVNLGGLGVDFKVPGDWTDGQLAIVEHPMEPGRLVPAHVHREEDELSYVLEGTFGVKIGDEIATAGPGTYVYKPKGIPHTFWNPGPEPARLIELIWPSRFEHFFRTLGELARSAADDPQAFERKRADLGREYALDFVPEWADELKRRYNLKLLGEP